MALLTNPLLPSNVFIPDVEPRVFGDRVYLYGSHDLPNSKTLCEGDYEVWSAPVSDLTDWTCHGTSYKRTQDPYIREVLNAGKGGMFNQYLYAPDVVCVDGRYYLFYGVAISDAGFGVAVADRPEGPFEYLGRVHYPAEADPDGVERYLGEGSPMIQLNPFKKRFGLHMKDYPYDPAVLVDGEHVYLYFGMSYVYVAELDRSDMLTLVKNEKTGRYVSKPLITKVSTLRQRGWTMGNGPSIRKIGDTYYLSFYGTKMTTGDNAMCYSTGQSPFGPFRFQGPLVKLATYGGNTHGGLSEIDGRWYHTYHRQTGDVYSGRQVCLQELERRPDGLFAEAEMKTQIQKDGGLPAKGPVPANTACFFANAKGRTKKGKSPALVLPDPDKDQVVGNLANGSVVGFKYFVFPNPEVSVSIELRNAGKGTVELLLDDPNGTALASAPVAKGQTEVTMDLTVGDEDPHALYLRFFGQKKAVFQKLVFE